jgi:hypothetical protein
VRRLSVVWRLPIMWRLPAVGLRVVRIGQLRIVRQRGPGHRKRDTGWAVASEDGAATPGKSSDDECPGTDDSGHAAERHNDGAEYAIDGQ